MHQVSSTKSFTLSQEKKKWDQDKSDGDVWLNMDKGETWVYKFLCKPLSCRSSISPQLKKKKQIFSAKEAFEICNWELPHNITSIIISLPLILTRKKRSQHSLEQAAQEQIVYLLYKL